MVATSLSFVGSAKLIPLTLLKSTAELISLGFFTDISANDKSNGKKLFYA